MKLLAIKIGFLGKFFTRAQVVVHGRVVQESPQRRGRNLTIQTLGDKSWDSTDLGRYGLGTLQSWDSAVLGRCGLGTLVLGQWSWDSGLGTVVLGHWYWDSGLGTVVLGQ